MSKGNMTGWSPDEMRAKVHALQDQVRQREKNGRDVEPTIDLIIECFSIAREVARVSLPPHWDPQNAYMKYPFIDLVLEFAPIVDPKMPLRKDLIDQGLEWIRYGERLDYDELKKGSYLYYWLRRADPNVVKSYYGDRFDPNPSSKSPYSDNELDAFYSENVQLVQQTMMREVHPDNGVVFEDPLRQRNAATYFEYYGKLLAISHGERELPKIDGLRMK